MRFNELPETEQIDKVKENFIEILSILAETPDKIGEYIKVPAKPVASGTMTDAQKAEFAKAEAEFEAASKQVAKIRDTLSNVQRPEGCFCGSCIEVKFGNQVPDELEFLLDEAQKVAEKASY